MMHIVSYKMFNQISRNHQILNPLLVSFSSYFPPKLSVSVTTDQLESSTLESMDTDN